MPNNDPEETEPSSVVEKTGKDQIEEQIVLEKGNSDPEMAEPSLIVEKVGEDQTKNMESVSGKVDDVEKTSSASGKVDDVEKTSSAPGKEENVEKTGSVSGKQENVEKAGSVSGKEVETEEQIVPGKEENVEKTGSVSEKQENVEKAGSVSGKEEDVQVPQKEASTHQDSIKSDSEINQTTVADTNESADSDTKALKGSDDLESLPVVEKVDDVKTEEAGSISAKVDDIEEVQEETTTHQDSIKSDGEINQTTVADLNGSVDSDTKALKGSDNLESQTVVEKVDELKTEEAGSISAKVDDIEEVQEEATTQQDSIKSDDETIQTAIDDLNKSVDSDTKALKGSDDLESSLVLDKVDEGSSSVSEQEFNVELPQQQPITFEQSNQEAKNFYDEINQRWRADCEADDDDDDDVPLQAPNNVPPLPPAGRLSPVKIRSTVGSSDEEKVNLQAVGSSDRVSNSNEASTSRVNGVTSAPSHQPVENPLVIRSVVSNPKPPYHNSNQVSSNSSYTQPFGQASNANNNRTLSNSQSFNTPFGGNNSSRGYSQSSTTGNASSYPRRNGFNGRNNHYQSNSAPQANGNVSHQHSIRSNENLSNNRPFEPTFQPNGNAPRQHSIRSNENVSNNRPFEPTPQPSGNAPRQHSIRSNENVSKNHSFEPTPQPSGNAPRLFVSGNVLKADNVDTSNKLLPKANGFDNYRTVGRPSTSTKNLEWHHTDQNVKSVPIKDLSAMFKPRSTPHSSNIVCDPTAESLRQIDYFICYSNTVISIGIVKRKQDVSECNAPLTMQFGHSKAHEGKKLCVGTTVKVRTYCKIFDESGSKRDNANNSHGNTGKSKFSQGNNFSKADIFKNEILFSNYMAVDWAIVDKPKIECTLGNVVAFKTTYQSDGSNLFHGKVFDSENDGEFEAADHLWPIYVKVPPAIKAAVVLNWVYVKNSDIQHVDYVGKNGVRFLFPAHVSELVKGCKDFDGYYLCWVDTRYSSFDP